MSDCLFESNLYELPIELRKFYVIVLMNAQRTQYHNGYSVINLKLEARYDDRNAGSKVNLRLINEMYSLNHEWLGKSHEIPMIKIECFSQVRIYQ